MSDKNLQFTSPDALPLPAVPPAPVVLGDLPCRKCSYNLRTLPTDSHCPECGTPVKLSLQRDLLAASDPKWLAKISCGMRCVNAGAISVFVVCINRYALNAAGRAILHLPLFSLLAVVAATILAAGFWLLTEPDPSGIGEDRHASLRIAARAVGMLLFAETILDIFYGYSAFPLFIDRALKLCLGGPAGLFGIVGFFAPIRYIGSLATRIPDPILHRRTNWLSILVPIGLSISITLRYVVEVFGSLRVGPPSSAFVALIFVTIAVLLLSFIPAFILIALMNKFSASLREQLSDARKNWSTHPV